MFWNKKKFYLEVTSKEIRTIIESLFMLRNKLIEEGKYTDAVDEMLVKLAG